MKSNMPMRHKGTLAKALGAEESPQEEMAEHARKMPPGLARRKAAVMEKMRGKRANPAC